VLFHRSWRRPTTLIVLTRPCRTVLPGLTASSEFGARSSLHSPADSGSFISNFPDPVKHERRQYAVYWQDKLKDNDRVEFPDSLLDDFAGKTEGFSFAYMKEAL